MNDKELLNLLKNCKVDREAQAREVIDKLSSFEFDCIFFEMFLYGYNLKEKRKLVESFRKMFGEEVCIYCSGIDTIKKGFFKGKQRYYCRKCKKTFIPWDIDDKDMFSSGR